MHAVSAEGDHDQIPLADQPRRPQTLPLGIRHTQQQFQRGFDIGFERQVLQFVRFVVQQKDLPVAEPRIHQPLLQPPHILPAELQIVHVRVFIYADQQRPFLTRNFFHHDAFVAVGVLLGCQRRKRRELNDKQGTEQLAGESVLHGVDSGEEERVRELYEVVDKARVTGCIDCKLEATSFAKRATAITPIDTVDV